MKFLQVYTREDFGKELVVKILATKNISVFQLSLDWNEYPAFPYVQISSGNGYILSFMFWVYKFGIAFDFLSRTWHY